MCTLRQLSLLHLHNMGRVTDAGMSNLGMLASLTSLDIRSCDLVTDAALAHIGHLVRKTSDNPFPLLFSLLSCLSMFHDMTQAVPVPHKETGVQ